jgi:ATP-dependent DNA helicase RecQ
LDAWRTESGDAELPVQDALEFFYESCSESRREFTYGEGVTLSTVHSAKGTEFDHVLLVGPWRLGPDRVAQEEERRAFYVGLTRARKTLAVFDRKDIRPSLPQTLTGCSVLRHEFSSSNPGQAEPSLSYKVLSLEDIHLGYPGQCHPMHPVHQALSALRADAKLTMRSWNGNGVAIFDHSDTCVARLSRKSEVEWQRRLATVHELRVLALVRRTSEQDPDETRRRGYRVPEWEIPVVEVVFREDING